MIKQELIKRSPIRILENSIHGGLGKGNLGVFTARKGVGKTACLIHVAIDKLLRDQNVLHISFADDPQHIEDWYRQVFQEVANHYKLDNAFEIYDQIVHQRIIIHFKQKDIDFKQICNSIDQIEEGTKFRPEVFILDGLCFENMTQEYILQWKNFAFKQKISIWFSATIHRDNLQLDEKGVPALINKFYDIFSVIIMLQPEQEFIDMKLIKDHDYHETLNLKLKLDPKTLLISHHRI
jgi:hypothetical protein